MSEVPNWKRKEVKKLSNLLETSPVVGVVDIEGIPAFQMQQMRSKLRGTANLTVSRNTLLEKAIDSASEKRESLEELHDYIEGQVALVSTGLNPFKLFKKMEETKTKAPASGGEIAPDDIMVEEGETPFKPGPIVGDLQKVGIPASIQGGKVVINQDKVVAEEGERISSDLATMLTRLDIHPITVGLDLKIVYEDGSVFERDVLDIDSSEYLEDFKSAAASAFNLTVNAAYPTKENIKTLISKTHQDAFNLAYNGELFVDETIELHISESHQKMLSLAAKIDPEALDDELREQLGIDLDTDSEEEQEEDSEDEEQEE